MRKRESGFEIRTDLCVIGGGAAGITIAQSFTGRGFGVCLVESGGLDYDDDTQNLYAGTSIGQPLELLAGRERFFGGATNHWGGRCAELSPSEVASRPWIPHSGWPLRLDEIQPYYRRAREVCGFEDDWPSGDDVLRMLRVPAPDDLTAAATVQLWRFAPNAGGLYWNFGKVYYDGIRRSSNVDLLLHANVTQFHTDGDGSHVNAVTVRSLSGVSGTVRARLFALCCGGIENARLLLAGYDRHPSGLGNAHGVVGRYFMEHLRGTAATLYTTQRLSPLEDAFNFFTGPDGKQYQVGLALSEQSQRKNGLLNCSAVLDYRGDPESGTTAVQEIWRTLKGGRWPNDVGTDVWHVLRDLHALEGNLERRLVAGRHYLLPLGSVGFIVDIEQAPNPESRISLGPRQDALGVPEVVVDWRVSELERATVRHFMLELGADFARRGIGRLRLEPWVEESSDSWKSGVGETYHYYGSTRMASDPRQGVVDIDCRVHGLTNLFVAGSSIFPTGGHVNPTLTITALALRLADHLHRELAA